MDLISYTCFVTEEIVDKDEYRKIEIHEACVSRTAKQLVIIALFWTTVLPLFGGTKDGRDSDNPI